MVGVRRTARAGAGQEAAPQLVLDLDTFRLCGTGCGEALAGLAFLGPGSPAGGPGEVEYPALGLTVEAAGGRVRGFRAHVHPTDPEVSAGIHPFAGLIRHRGAAFDAAAITSEAAVVDRFGPPDAVESLAAGWALRFAAGRVGWEALLAADGRLATLRVSGRDD